VLAAVTTTATIIMIPKSNEQGEIQDTSAYYERRKKTQ
jgi:hypothetical protein